MRIPHSCYFMLLGLALLTGWMCQPNLYTTAGQRITFSTMHRDKPVALIFLAPDCPISQKYVLTINQLRKEHPETEVLGIFTKWCTSAEIEAYQTAFLPEFPCYADRKNSLVKQLNARTTPEVFLLNSRREVVYQGAIDNWFYALGKYRSAPTEHYLRDAMADLANGRDIKVKRTQALGCAIEY